MVVWTSACAEKLELRKCVWRKIVWKEVRGTLYALVRLRHPLMMMMIIMMICRSWSWSWSWSESWAHCIRQSIVQKSVVCKSMVCQERIWTSACFSYNFWFRSRKSTTLLGLGLRHIFFSTSILLKIHDYGRVQVLCLVVVLGSALSAWLNRARIRIVSCKETQAANITVVLEMGRRRSSTLEI